MTHIEQLMTIDIPHWQRGADNFNSRLFSLINKADRFNLHKIRKVYPDHVKALERWYKRDL